VEVVSVGINGKVCKELKKACHDGTKMSSCGKGNVRFVLVKCGKRDGEW
jgi:hypothetical protein